ncbi:FG-GAP repeat domain-containing protein [Seonamhaeicola marinus]|uniref:VCBS repeat-containing protein n=1 Tax=Seonamhaeicola marinus TaxID=1912246 RepID=A0A5D0IK87_9FLAO|nr:VCBS repeat-containing protein [Seonamhaeicola marinus]TYA84303.1 VCBS repeat-containing protein [Seonamhaeicola marinus]
MNIIKLNLKLKHTYIIPFYLICVLCYTCKSDKKEAKPKVTTEVKDKSPELFSKVSIGKSFNEPPQISHLAANDIDDDGYLDVIICDIKNDNISLIKQSSNNQFTETILSEDTNIPAHVQVLDFDLDGDKDLIVAGLGMLFPNNDKIGSVILLENDGHLNFTKHIAAENLARVADVRAGDIDGDGDMDLVTAQFGYDDGQTSWIENLGNWSFKNHSLQNVSGPINVELVDIDSDNDLDIISLVSQEWEEIYCFTNDGKGTFESKLLWGSSNEDFGSSGISISDINKDGKPDVLYTNGDAFDYIPPLPRPWHGIQWLENQGDLKFRYHRVCDFPGAFSARVIDFDKDGDEDIFAVSGFNYWEKPEAESLIWLENSGNNAFKKHTIAKTPTHLITMEIGDFNNDGFKDLVTAGVYVYPPYDNIDRVTLWLNKGATK